ncbi:MAG: thioredoxin [Planctomycetota bacterium]
MKLSVYFRLLVGLVVISCGLLGCNNLPTTGTSIAGAPDGIAEIMVVTASGKTSLEKIGFLEAVDRKDQKLVLIDFWAPWCGPCRQLSPSLEAAKKKWGDKLDVVKVNVDDNQAIAQHLGVTAIPDVRIFSNGTQVGDFVGVRPQDEIDGLLRSLQ